VKDELINQPDTSVGQRNIWVPLFSLCPTLVSCWLIHPSHFITELEIHHLCSFITSPQIYPKMTNKFTKQPETQMYEMSREIFDCLKRERDICVKTIIPSRNTAFMCTPALISQCNKLCFHYVRNSYDFYDQRTGKIKVKYQRQINSDAHSWELRQK